MKNIELEICLDNIESVDICRKIEGVDRIELCSGLALGGLSPLVSLVKYAKKNSNGLLFPMIRPRAGDFCFSDSCLNIMLDEISMYADLGANGVVIGALDEKFNIDLKATEKLCNKAENKKLSVTFHRAIDYVSDYNSSIEQLIQMGIDRILTSGQKSYAVDGINNIAEVQSKYGKQIEIMAGSGINVSNVREIIEKTGINKVHCSASSNINKFDDVNLSLGSSSSTLEYQLTDIVKLKNIINELKLL